MKNYLIFASCRSHKTDRVEIEQHIHSLGEFLSHEDDLWIIRSDKSNVELRDSLLPLLDDFDPLLVAVMGSDLSHACWGSNDLQRLEEWFKVDG